MFRITKIVKRHFCSALFVPKSKASEHCVILTPHIDFDKQKQTINLELRNNTKHKNSVEDLEDLNNLWILYKQLINEQQQFETKKQSISDQIKRALKNDEASSEEFSVETLKLHSKLLSNDLKRFKEALNEVETNVFTKILALPNLLHERTPTKTDQVIHEFKTRPTQQDNWTKVDLNDNCLILDSKTCYLKNRLALNELKLSNYLSDSFQNDFTRLSNSDFSRSVVVEGCGVDSTFKLLSDFDSNRLHLTGSASLMAFMAYFTKHLVFSSLLPLKFYTTGRVYEKLEPVKKIDLLHLEQNTCLSTLIATLDDDLELDRFVDKLKSIFDRFQLHYKLVVRNAKKLLTNESLRVDIEMWSFSENDYVTVGFISMYGTYLSQRLLFECVEKNRDNRFPKIIYSKLDFNKFLACALQQSKQLQF